MNTPGRGLADGAHCRLLLAHTLCFGEEGKGLLILRVQTQCQTQRSGDLDALVTDDVLDGHVAADRFEVAADSADLGVVQVTVLDL